MLFKHFEYPTRWLAAMSIFYSSTSKAKKKHNNMSETFNN